MVEGSLLSISIFDILWIHLGNAHNRGCGLFGDALSFDTQMYRYQETLRWSVCNKAWWKVSDRPQNYFMICGGLLGGHHDSNNRLSPNQSIWELHINHGGYHFAFPRINLYRNEAWIDHLALSWQNRYHILNWKPIYSIYSYMWCYAACNIPPWAIILDLPKIICWKE